MKSLAHASYSYNSTYVNDDKKYNNLAENPTFIRSSTIGDETGVYAYDVELSNNLRNGAEGHSNRRL